MQLSHTQPKVRAPGPERSQEGWLESRGLRHPHRGPRGPGAQRPRATRRPASWRATRWIPLRYCAPCSCARHVPLLSARMRRARYAW